MIFEYHCNVAIIHSSYPSPYVVSKPLALKVYNNRLHKRGLNNTGSLPWLRLNMLHLIFSKSFSNISLGNYGPSGYKSRMVLQICPISLLAVSPTWLVRESTCVIGSIAAAYSVQFHVHKRFSDSSMKPWWFRHASFLCTVATFKEAAVTKRIVDKNRSVRCKNMNAPDLHFHHHSLLPRQPPPLNLTLLENQSFAWNLLWADNMLPRLVAVFPPTWKLLEIISFIWFV